MRAFFVLNIGATFNKKYNQVTDSLKVPQKSDAIGEILTQA